MSSLRTASGMLAAALLLAPIPLSAFALATPVPCMGDCNRDGAVAIDELTAGVTLALGDVSSQRCLRAFCSANCGPGPGFQLPDVACLTRALNAALDGCPVTSCGTDRDCDDGNLGTDDQCTAEGCRNECLLVGP